MTKFPELFNGLDRAYGRFIIEDPIPGKVKREGKATTITAPVADDLYQKHLNGIQGLGIVPIRDDGTCVFGALDVDEYSISLPKLNARIRELNLPLVVCRTKSGGAHLYLFCAPTPASIVRQYLESVGTILGVFPCELFPKQDSIRAADTGNWINLPYFNATETDRYALDDDGSPITDLESFVAFASDHIVSELVLPDLHDGPPCLQLITAKGVDDGTRNSTMFNYGVYARKSHGDDWQQAVEDFNGEMYKTGTTPLPSSELQATIKSLEKKNYAYTCDKEPLASVCNRAVCMRRKYGVGKEDVIPSREALSPDAVVLPGGPQSITVAAREVFTKLVRDGEFVRRGQIVFHADYDTPNVSMIDAEALRSRIETAGVEDGVRQTYSATTRGYKPEIAALSDCKGMLASESVSRLPNVKAFSMSPIILDTGEVKTWGIEKEILILAGDQNFRNITVEQARDDLLALSQDYSFRSAADRSRCMAALITPLLRISGLLGGHAPISIFEADQSHAGKTKLANVIFAIYGDDNPASVVSKEASEGGVGGLTESMNHAYLTARNFVFLDNLRTDGAFANAFLESAVTNNGTQPVRVPYAGFKEIDVSRISVVVTANDLVLNRDLANRSNMIFVIKRSDDHTFHDWGGVSLEQHVRANREHYFSCVASIVREWIINHGRAQADERGIEHDLRQWACKVDYICRMIMGLESPFSDYRAVQAAKVDTEALWFEKWCQTITNPACNLTASQWVQSSGISTKGIFDSSTDLGLATPVDSCMKLGYVMRRLTADRQCFVVGGRFTVTVGVRKTDRGKSQKLYWVADVQADEPAY